MNDSYWFKHDANARHDPKIRKLRREKGAVAKAVYWDLIEMLRCCDGKMPIDDAVAEVCDENRLESTDIPLYVIQESGLFEYGEGYFWSNRLLEEIAFAKERAERNRANGMRGGRPRKETENKPNGNPEETQKKPSGFLEGTQKKPTGNPEKTTVTDNSNSNTNSNNLESKDSCPTSPKSDSPEEKDLLSFDKESKNLTPDEFRDLWNDGRGKCPKVLALNDDRRKKAKLRIAEMGKTKSEQTATMQAVMTKIRESDFLQNGGKGSDWRISFDWLIENSVHWLKVLEGNYDNRKYNDGKYNNDKWNN